MSEILVQQNNQLKRQVKELEAEIIERTRNFMLRQGSSGKKSVKINHIVTQTDTESSQAISLSFKSQTPFISSTQPNQYHPQHEKQCIFEPLSTESQNSSLSHRFTFAKDILKAQETVQLQTDKDILANEVSLYRQQISELEKSLLEKQAVIDSMNNDLTILEDKLGQEILQNGELEEEILRIKEVLSTKSVEKRDIFSSNDCEQANQFLMSEKTNKKYGSLIAKLEERVESLNAALLWSEEENYKFRMTIRKLSEQQKALKSDKSLDSRTWKSRCTSQSEKPGKQNPDSSKNPRLSKKSKGSLANLFNKAQNTAFYEKMSKQLFEIVNCLPIAEDDDRLMFEPESEEDVYYILSEIHRFCSLYEQKINELNIIQIQEQSEIVQVLTSLIDGFSISKPILMGHFEQAAKCSYVKNRLHKFYSETDKQKGTEQKS